ncbi:MAG: orotate phosphoribosyltransferase [Symploca sp. SIO2G7]|nr:orotate phosphoribosyltransferase [Symploca sp. SIO2G7]
MHIWSRRFIDLAIRSKAIRFGEYTLKSGRISPFFFNAGQFNDGAALVELGDIYADAIVNAIHQHGLEFDLMFGPAYKGIPLVAVVAASLARRHRLNVPIAYDRKEAKAHGEGGQTVGAEIKGRVLIVDDVLSGGTAFNQSRPKIENAGGQVVGLVIGMDRQERARGSQRSASDTVRASGAHVVAVASLEDVIERLRALPDYEQHVSAMLGYQSEYGAGENTGASKSL